jgi:hypothetical protein
MKSSADPLILYSTNSWLAYAVAERYYGRQHYVWCTPFFDPGSTPSLDYAVPPSSSPAEIYRGLMEDVRRGDRHSAKIDANKAGILRGAQSKMTNGDIVDEEASEIGSIVNEAEVRDFTPLVFVIPHHLVKGIIREVPVNQRAHPMSREYIIDKLPRSSFDVIKFDGRL